MEEIELAFRLVNSIFEEERNTFASRFQSLYNENNDVCIPKNHLRLLLNLIKEPNYNKELFDKIRCLLSFTPVYEPEDFDNAIPSFIEGFQKMKDMPGILSTGSSFYHFISVQDCSLSLKLVSKLAQIATPSTPACNFLNNFKILLESIIHSSTENPDSQGKNFSVNRALKILSAYRNSRITDADREVYDLLSIYPYISYLWRSLVKTHSDCRDLILFIAENPLAVPFLIENVPPSHTIDQLPPLSLLIHSRENVYPEMLYSYRSPFCLSIAIFLIFRKSKTPVNEIESAIKCSMKLISQMKNGYASQDALSLVIFYVSSFPILNQGLYAVLWWAGQSPYHQFRNILPILLYQTFDAIPIPSIARAMSKIRTMATQNLSLIETHPLTPFRSAIRQLIFKFQGNSFDDSILSKAISSTYRLWFNFGITNPIKVLEQLRVNFPEPQCVLHYFALAYAIVQKCDIDYLSYQSLFRIAGHIRGMSDISNPYHILVLLREMTMKRLIGKFDLQFIKTLIPNIPSLPFFGLVTILSYYDELPTPIISQILPRMTISELPQMFKSLITIVSKHRDPYVVYEYLISREQNSREFLRILSSIGFSDLFLDVVSADFEIQNRINDIITKTSPNISSLLSSLFARRKDLHIDLLSLEQNLVHELTGNVIVISE